MFCLWYDKALPLCIILYTETTYYMMRAYLFSMESTISYFMNQKRT